MPKIQRFKGVQGVRQYVARVLIGLEKQVAADVGEATKLAAAQFTGARLMAELIRSTTLERRLNKLERAEGEAVAAVADLMSRGERVAHVEQAPQ
jgi:hypothetical protein